MYKILLIGPYQGAWRTEQGVYYAFKNLGHSVSIYDHRNNEYVTRESKLVSCRSADGPPDIPMDNDIILAIGPGLPKKILESDFFKNGQGQKVLWTSEPIRLPAYKEKMKEQIGHFDHILTFDESELSLFKEIGIKAAFLPQAFNADNYYPLKDIEPKGQICFVGAINNDKHVNRYYILDRLRKSFDVTVRIGIFNPKEINKLYNEHKMVLNLGLYCPPYAGPIEEFRAYGLQNRVFECIGSGSVCLTNEIPTDSNMLFENKKNIVLYNTQNLEDMVKWALVNYKIVRQNVLEVREHHDYETRMSEFLNMMGPYL